MAKGEDEEELATLVARLELALARSEESAVRLQRLSERHLRLERESRAAVSTLDRLIAASG